MYVYFINWVFTRLLLYSDTISMLLTKTSTIQIATKTSPFQRLLRVLARPIDSRRRLARSAWLPRRLARSAWLPGRLARSAWLPRRLAHFTRLPRKLAHFTRLPRKLTHFKKLPRKLALFGRTPAFFILGIYVKSLNYARDKRKQYVNNNMTHWARVWGLFRCRMTCSCPEDNFLANLSVPRGIFDPLSNLKNYLLSKLLLECAFLSIDFEKLLYQ